MFLLWIGGVCEEFDTIEQAQELFEDYEAEGYTDLIIEEVLEV